MAFDLMAAIETYREGRAQEVQERSRRYVEATLTATADTLKRFEAWLHDTFSAELLDALHLEQIGVDVDVNPHARATTRFTVDGVIFPCVWDGSTLEIRTAPDVGFYWVASDADLIAAVSDLLENVAARQAELAEEARVTAAALAEHTRCQERVAAVLAATVPWQWPVGRELVIYHWTWCTAPGDDGAAVFDDGYSLQSDLNSAGIVELEVERGTPPRTLLLRYATPIAECLVLRSVADLPRALRQLRTVGVPDVGHTFEQCDADGDPLLTRAPGEMLTIETGDEWPLAWIRGALLC